MHTVKIAQQPISDNHKNSLFFDGYVAEGIKTDNNIYYLMTYQYGQIKYKEINYCADEIRKLGEDGNVDDNVIEFTGDVDVVVDRYLIITDTKQKPVDVDFYIYDNFDDAIQGFQDFLNKE
jgi:hypothetical protein